MVLIPTIPESASIRTRMNFCSPHIHYLCSTLYRNWRGFATSAGRRRHGELEVFHPHCFRGRRRATKCQEDRVFIGFLVAREKELHFGCTPFKRRLLSLLRNLHFQATVEEHLRPHVVAQVQACPLRRHTRDRSLDHVVRKQSAVVFMNVTQSKHPHGDHHQA